MTLRAENICKQYKRLVGEGNCFHAVRPVSLAVESGTVTVLLGRSGSGKTTLLNMMAGLLAPTSGTVSLGETSLYDLSDAQLARLRNEKIGIVPQGRAVLDTLTVLENLLLPGTLYGGNTKEQEARAKQLLEELDITSLRDVVPKELSGGELRRVAIARALLYKPEVLLADEPTGDLDDENTEIVLKALKKAAEQGAAVLLVTHDSAALPYADIVYRMDAGVLQAVSSSSTDRAEEEA